MTAMPLQPFTAAETARLARIEAAGDAPESWAATVELAAAAMFECAMVRARRAAGGTGEGHSMWADAPEVTRWWYLDVADAGLAAALAAMHPADETLRAVTALADELDEDQERAYQRSAKSYLVDEFSDGQRHAYEDAATRLRAVLGGEL